MDRNTGYKYVINGITKGWAEKWKNNGWKRNKNAQAINSDLWGSLLNAIAKHTVEFNWVKGHAGHTENEHCDTLANIGINSTELLVDSGYEPKDIDKEKSTSINTNYSNNKKVKIEKEGDNCRKCGELVVKKNRKKKKKIKRNQTYYFEYVLLCPSCKTMYITEDAKREITPENNLFE